MLDSSNKLSPIHVNNRRVRVLNLMQQLSQYLLDVSHHRLDGLHKTKV